jgi:hypothetical protein
MNSSIEQARKQTVDDLNIGFIEYNIVENKHDSSQIIENFYLTESSDLDDSLLEHFKTAQTCSFEQTNYLSIKSYESDIYHIVKPKSASKSINMRPAQPIIQSIEQDKSLNINCKTLCKTFANKIFNKLLSKKSLSKSKSLSKTEQANKELIVDKKLKNPVNMNISSHEFNSKKFENNNCFANFGDIVYYNV